MIKIYTIGAAVAALSLVATSASAQVYLSDAEVAAMTYKSSTYQGKLDGVKDGDVLEFKVHGPNKFTYKYLHTAEEHTFEERLARAGGQRAGNPTLNHTEDDKEDVRFEWTDLGEITFHYWAPGKKAGQRTNNPPMAKTVLKQVETSLADPAKVKKAAREKVAQIIEPGSYIWENELELTVKPGGEFEAKEDGQTIEGFFIANGDDICFDLVGGNCYTVSQPNSDGARTLTMLEKLMNSLDKNTRAGLKTTLAPKT